MLQGFGVVSDATLQEVAGKLGITESADTDSSSQSKKKKKTSCEISS